MSDYNLLARSLLCRQPFSVTNMMNYNCCSKTPGSNRIPRPKAGSSEAPLLGWVCRVEERRAIARTVVAQRLEQEVVPHLFPVLGEVEDAPQVVVAALHALGDVHHRLVIRIRPLQKPAAPPTPHGWRDNAPTSAAEPEAAGKRVRARPNMREGNARHRDCRRSPTVELHQALPVLRANVNTIGYEYHQ